jgi:transposase
MSSHNLWAQLVYKYYVFILHKILLLVRHNRYMAELWEKHIHEKLKELELYLLEEYKKNHPQKEEDYAEYEKEFRRRFRKAINELPSMIDKATTNLKFYRGKGDKPSLKADQRLRLLLISQLAGKSNRMMAYMARLFAAITGIDRSYKTIERLYSDREVELALFNLWILMLEKNKVKETDCCGDATGYGLFISKHYCSIVQKLKDKAKDSENTKKCFVYKFALMDLSTKMYICVGTSLISERKAFDKAMQMLKETGVKINSIRLDRYYSHPCDVNLFPDSKVYIIPREDAKLGHGIHWYETMKSFVDNTLNYLEEYYKRENSESGWSADKKMFGWNVRQKREDRIDTALFCRAVWHNLFRL